MIKTTKMLALATLSSVMLFTGCSQKDADVEVSETTVAPTNVTKVYELGSLDSKGVKNINFDFDKYDIRKDMVVVADNNAFTIKSLNVDEITLEGNTDEWGSDEYNYALGLKRADSVKTTLTEKGYTNVTLVSYGESKPVCKDKNKNCDAENRRVEYKATK